MAQCPACGIPLNDDFGLVECSRCGAGLFIEFDGQVLRREGTSPNPAAVGQADEETPDIGSLSLGPEQSFGSPAEEPPPPPVPGDEIDESDRTELSGPGGGDRTVVTGSVAEDLPLRPAPPMLLAEPAADSEAMAEISSFANSNAAAGRDGSYHYDLFISGIDSSDVRNSIKEVLNDQLFLWDVETLIRSIVNGELRISQVTAIKAAIVVQRMSELPVKVKWVQHALAQS